MLILKLFLAFFKLGLIGFGGGNAILFIFQDIANEFIGLGYSTFWNDVALAQTLPGILSINLTVLLGYKIYGVIGVLVSIIGFISPSIIIAVILSTIIQKFIKENSIVLTIIKIIPIFFIVKTITSLLTLVLRQDGYILNLIILVLFIFMLIKQKGNIILSAIVLGIIVKILNGVTL
ncbi:MAG: chromate transporter [Sarcina sp.]